MNVWLHITVLLFSKIVFTKSTYTTVILTDSGPLRGEILTTVRTSTEYASFTRIPYAEPPTGDLRFKPPVAKTRWRNVLDATDHGTVCTQYNSTDDSVIGQEDCLFLGVHTPLTSFHNITELKAVMVWIHGGGWTVGNPPPLAKKYKPDFLIEDDVVVVYVNYRLGAFGFLNLNSGNASGNFGLKDQNLALKWVHKNIRMFGGDPDKVTVVGQSAGGASVDYHMVSPLSAGLFSRGISMSGSALCITFGIQTTKDAESNAFTLGSKLGTKTSNKNELFEVLYKASAANIASKSHEIATTPFQPTMENYGNDQDKFISECTLKRLLTGNYTKMPRMLGSTSNEGKAMMLKLQMDKKDFFNVINRLVPLAKNVFYLLQEASIPLNIPIFEEVLSSQNDLKSISKETYQKFIKTASDLVFGVGVDVTQRLLNIHNNHPIYYYRFAFDANLYLGNPDKTGYNITGVGHTQDTAYFLYIPSANLPIDQPDVKRTIDRYVRLTTNFAKYGNPTPNGEHDDLLGITWPNSGSLGKHLEINKDLSIGSRPIDDTVQLGEIMGIATSPILTACACES